MSDKPITIQTQRFLALIENSADGIALFSPQGSILYGSPATTRILGYTLDEFVGRNAFDLIYPDDHAYVASQLAEALQKPATRIHVHAHVRHKDGSWRFLEGVFTNLLADPSVGAIVNNYRDATERKREEAALRQSEERFAKAFRASPVAQVIRRLSDNTFIDMNDSYHRLLGYRREEVIGHTVIELDLYANPDQRADLGRMLQEQGAIRDYEIALRAKSGAIREVIFSTETIELDGETCALSILYDISERKHAEQSLQRYTERLKHLRKIDQSVLAGRSLEEIAQAAVVHIWHLIPCTRVSVVLVDMVAQTITLLAAQVDGELRAPPGLQAPIEILGAAFELLKLGQIYQVPDLAALPELPPALRAAQVEHVRAYVYVPILADSELVGMLNLGSDQPGAFLAEHLEIGHEVANQLSIAIQQSRLREQVRSYAQELEQRVIARTAELEAANKELEAFSYSVSHDLRAPLRAIDGFSRILLEDYNADLQEEAQHYLQLVRDNTQQMGRLIDDLLAFARLGRQPLFKQPVAPADLVRQSLNSLSAEQAGRPVEISIDNLPACEGDPALLKQVWINLIANALKYTRQRAPALIEIGCQVEGGETIYFVKDNGVGFDMRYIHKLFGVFQRLHRVEDYEGTGVGLAIVQRVIHRHGGRVWAEAKVDCGAAFYFTLGGRA